MLFCIWAKLIRKGKKHILAATKCCSKCMFNETFDGLLLINDKTRNFQNILPACFIINGTDANRI